MKKFIAGFILGSMMFSGIVYAATTSIDVAFLPLKYYFDMVEKAPRTDQKGFIFKGTTYVPLRFAAESLGKEVTYDAKTTTIYVGKQPGGKITHMKDMRVLAEGSIGEWKPIDSKFETNIGEVFMNGYSGQGKLDKEYLLNNKYKKFEVLVAPPQLMTQYPRDQIVFTYLKIYADDEIVYEQGKLENKDFDKALNIELDLAGVNKLRIEMWSHGNSVALLDPKFIE